MELRTIIEAANSGTILDDFSLLEVPLINQQKTFCGIYAVDLCLWETMCLAGIREVIWEWSRIWVFMRI